jgi:hypothetical protein
MTYCNLCDLPLASCEHGLADRNRTAARSARLLISPDHYAHFEGCPHKDDPDYLGWSVLETPNAWQRLGNGEHLRATGPACPGGRSDLVATRRCKDCEDHGGPW